MEALLLLLVTVLALSTAATIPSDRGLHVVFAIDGTTGVEREGFDTEKSLVMDLSDALPAHSTVGIIAVGPQPQNVLPFSELPLSVDRILSIAFPRSSQFNLSGSLLLAQEELSSLRGHGVIVVITARDLLCDESPSTDPAICRTVARIRSSGTVVITVGIRFSEMMTWPRQFLDDNRFSLRANRTLLPDFTALLVSLKMCSHEFSRSERPSSTSTHAAPVNLATVDAACSGTYSELWLDLMIMVDSSAGPAEDGFITFVSMLLDLVEDLKIGQNGKKTRLSLVNMGTTAHVVSDLNTFSSTQEALDAIQGLRYLNDAELNLQEGLRAALNISRVQGRRNARQLFVLFSTKPADCPDEQAPNSPCRIAFDVRQQGVLMTVAVGYKDTGIPSISSLATPCYSLTNTGDFETRFASLATKANCFCDSGLWKQATQGCDLYNTCFYTIPAAQSWAHANRNCRLHGGSLPIVRNERSQLITEHLWEEYGESQWIGIHTDGSGTGVWNDGEVFHDHEYNHFLDPSKLVANQFMAIQKIGQGSPWLTYNSSVVLNSVTCQKTACSVNNYCPDNV